MGAPKKPKEVDPQLKQCMKAMKMWCRRFFPRVTEGEMKGAFALGGSHHPDIKAAHHSLAATYCERQVQQQAVKNNQSAPDMVDEMYK